MTNINNTIIVCRFNAFYLVHFYANYLLFKCIFLFKCINYLNVFY